jgi:hypothetical protein
MTDNAPEEEQTERLLERLIVENAHLRKENRYLRKRLPEKAGDMRVLRRAYADAKTLLVWRFSGFPIGRRSSYAQGMSVRRWQWARALLRASRIHNGRDIIEPDFDAAMFSLTHVYNLLEKAGGIERLRVYLPESCQ